MLLLSEWSVTTTQLEKSLYWQAKVYAIPETTRSRWERSKVIKKGSIRGK